VVGLSSGVILMPRFGITGAAAAFLASSLTQTVVAFLLSRSVYPVTYEAGRLLRVVASGVLAALAGLWIPAIGHPLINLAARALVTAAVFAGLIAASGFLRRTELAFLREMAARFRRRSVAAPGPRGGD
jgi:O-antigen/teichoic acid export membrane protein